MLHQVILKQVIEFERQELKWIVLVQDGDNLLTFVNPVMNILVSQTGGNFCAR